ncbi:uncharacterized protein LY89DRAFT_496254 [Mollisia scopiformis]|uniref:Uncharacterized protein n=1 Tax=Mollisia scopiformis TaxID=149040 RepID=A0A194XHG9_MOLSC|nr:uncharacterized protein LY89DRAFT_496254 [Mollisia scopiformis]KUJ19608.1 hypothetical protein LY89DRAFT_496254 [Mollisia scopiformis]
MPSVRVNPRKTKPPPNQILVTVRLRRIVPCLPRLKRPPVALLLLSAANAMYPHGCGHWKLSGCAAERIRCRCTADGWMEMDANCPLQQM